MSFGPADLCFFANVQHELGRPLDAISYFKQFISANPNLNRHQRSSFLTIFKTAFDPLRKNIGILSDALVFEEYHKHQEAADKIISMRDRCRQELSTLCTETIDLIDKFLLPNAEDVQGRVFYSKFRGDLFRYLAERANPADQMPFNDEAKKAYLKGIELGAELPNADPIFLGTLLNYAVFLRDHLNDHSGAIEIVVDGANNGRKQIGELERELRAEAENVLTLMESNLMSWDEEESLNEEEDNGKQ
jgi:tetratricopeptide (TPR) repeat protein